MSAPTLHRREFLRLGAVAGAALAAQAVAPGLSWAAGSRIDLEECLAMTPVRMAERSGPVMASWRSLLATVDTIRNPVIRDTVRAILDNPAPTIVADMDAAHRTEIYESLVAQGLLLDVAEADFLPPSLDPSHSPQPFYSAPGSGYQSHHSYPGGVVTHTDLNVRVSLALYDGYREVYDYLLDRDVVVASQVLHDLHKAWVFQWGEEADSRTERTLAGTGEHHPLSVAESIHRGLPAELCVAQACAHNHPGFAEDETGPVNWIKTACILLGKDPVEAGMLASGGETLPVPRRMEGFVCHLGDHDWVLSVPTAKWLIPELQRIAVEQYKLSEADLGGKPFNSLRNYVFSQATIMGLYETLVTQGHDGLARSVAGIVRPV